jgi:hypothetical protein
VFHPPGSTLCNLDLALVVLDRSITVAPPMRVRLTAPVAAGESLRAVGYGQNDKGAPVGTRFRKDSVAVLAVGSTVSASQTPLAGSEFEVGESMCEGDSGGPAIDETTGAIVGIVSRGGACTDPSGHIYTSLAGFGAIFQQAFAVAGGAPIGENDPAPTGDGGTPTAQDGGAGSVATGSSSGSSDTSGSSSGGAYSTAPVNLRSGAGQNCAMSPAPAGQGAAGASAPPLLLLLAAATAAMTRVRRRRTVR